MVLACGFDRSIKGRNGRFLAAVAGDVQVLERNDLNTDDSIEL